MNQALRLAVVFATVTLLWNLYGFAGNFFAHYWGGSERPVVLISYLVNALLLICLALVSARQERVASLLALAGLVMALWSLGGVAIEVGVMVGSVTRDPVTTPLNLPEPAPLLGALLPAITGALTAFWAWKGRRPWVLTPPLKDSANSTSSDDQ